MPYTSTEPMLPWAPGSDTSHDAAVAAQPAALTQLAMMRQAYERQGSRGLTDAEMHRRTGLAINVICARRKVLKAACCGKRMGAHGVRVKAWTLPALLPAEPRS